MSANVVCWPLSLNVGLSVCPLSLASHWTCQRLLIARCDWIVAIILRRCHYLSWLPVALGQWPFTVCSHSQLALNHDASADKQKWPTIETPELGDGGTAKKGKEPTCKWEADVLQAMIGLDHCWPHCLSCLFPFDHSATDQRWGIGCWVPCVSLLGCLALRMLFEWILLATLTSESRALLCP